jgi:hypothetical protein
MSTDRIVPVIVPVSPDEALTSPAGSPADED